MKRIKLILLVLVWMMLPLIPKSQSILAKIDSLKSQWTNSTSPDKSLALSFDIADNFMELNLYDSAQAWLNIIAEQLPLKQPSTFNYFLSTRQAEVYYYNGLQRLGLQESGRSLLIAQTLKDSVLLADAYNFLGLFLINLDSNRQAIPYFQRGITYTRQPPYKETYLSLTKPHHLYGNMAEAYEKLGIYDSAVYLSRISLQLATAIDWKRGIAVAHSNMGNAFLKGGQPDSALLHYHLSKDIARLSRDVDVVLLNLGGMARSEDLLGKSQQAMSWLNEGFEMIGNETGINNLFTGQFINEAVYLYRKYNQPALLGKALDMKAQLLQKQLTDNNRQVNVILNAGLQNETRLLNLQVSEAKQRTEIVNTRLYLLLSLLVLVLAGFFLYRYKTRGKLQSAQLKNKISQDLHDDVGSSLSSLQVYSTVAEQVLEREPAKAREMLRKISKEAIGLQENIGDIVWAMKTGKEQSINLDSRIKNFISDVLGAANIQYTINVEEEADYILRNMTARKNVLLIIKEAVNNIVKYSKAKHVSVTIKRLAGQLCVQVSDDGAGFNAVAAEGKGEGLGNMRNRVEELKGIFEITTNPGKGTTISALFPLTSISDTV